MGRAQVWGAETGSAAFHDVMGGAAANLGLGYAPPTLPDSAPVLPAGPRSVRSVGTANTFGRRRGSAGAAAHGSAHGGQADEAEDPEEQGVRSN